MERCERLLVVSPQGGPHVDGAPYQRAGLPGDHPEIVVDSDVAPPLVRDVEILPLYHFEVGLGQQAGYPDCLGDLYPFVDEPLEADVGDGPERVPCHHRLGHSPDGPEGCPVVARLVAVLYVVVDE